MRFRSRIALIALAAAAVAGPAHPEGPPPFRIVVNAANPISAISRDDLGKIFLKRATTWPGGAPAAPVDQPDSRPVREAFSRQVLGKSVAAVRSYWQQRIFSGRDVPPPERPGDAEVIAFIRGNPDAVGYVSGGAEAAGVKVLPIQD